MANSKKVAIFYTAYINPKANWKLLIKRQMDDFKKSNLSEISDLYISIINPSATRDAFNFISQISPENTKIQDFHENSFEYRAIKNLWDTCSNNENNYELVAYFHTKGMSYAKKRRSLFEYILTNGTILNWKKVLSVFRYMPDVDVCCLIPGEKNGHPFGWFNFWWARPSYIASLKDPEITEDRYYYEFWLSESSQQTSKSYSLLSNSHISYSNDEASEIMENISKNLKIKNMAINAILKLLKLSKLSKTEASNEELKKYGINMEVIYEVINR